MGAELEQTPLHFAVINGNLEIVTYLVENGADVLVLDEINNLPIDYAIDEADIEIINYFKEYQELSLDRYEKIENLERINV